MARNNDDGDAEAAIERGNTTKVNHVDAGEAAGKKTETSSLLDKKKENSKAGDASEISDDECYAAVWRAKRMMIYRWAQMGVLFSYLGIFFASAKSKGGDDFSLMEIGYLYTSLMGGMALGSYILPGLADYYQRHVTFTFDRTRFDLI